MTKELLIELLHHWLSPAVDQGSLLQWRSAVHESQAFLGMARSDDLRRLRKDQVKISPLGLLLVSETRKNDQQTKGHGTPISRDPNSRYCPVRLVQACLEKISGIWSLPKLRKIRPKAEHEILGL